MATVCPHCAYDFPVKSSDKSERRGLAYSGLADLSLVVGMLCTILGAILMLVLTGAALLVRDFRGAFSGLISFFTLLALFVVFQRVADMD
ncbi:MAG TPA: hypothetical protein VF719_03545 [Abditibacteriaceae bacterium]